MSLNFDFKKLTKEQVLQVAKAIETLDKNKNASKSITRPLRTHVEKYYDVTNASQVCVSYSSEYNDNNYNYTIAYIGVYDNNGNEILPKPETAKESRRLWQSIAPYRVEGYSDTSETDDVYFLKEVVIPDIYVKVDQKATTR